LPFSLQAPGVGLQEGYLDLFSPPDLPQDLYPPLPSGALQSTQPPFLPFAPLRPNQSRREDSFDDSVPAFLRLASLFNAFLIVLDCLACDLTDLSNCLEISFRSSSSSGVTSSFFFDLLPQLAAPTFLHLDKAPEA